MRLYAADVGIYYSQGGVPLPDDGDPVAQGALRMRNLGEALDPLWTTFALSTSWTAHPSYPPAYRIIGGMVFLSGSATYVSATWSGALAAFATVAALDPFPAAAAPIGLINRPMVYSTAAQPATARLGWMNVRTGGVLACYAAATPADAIVASLDGISWRAEQFVPPATP